MFKRKNNTSAEREKHTLFRTKLVKICNLFRPNSQICPGLNASEIQIPFDKHHKLQSLVKSHQNTHNSVKYVVIWKCQITLPNMKY